MIETPVKTYQATTMAQALAQVKRDLGRDAIIVRTRSYRKGRLWGLFGGRNIWEVSATANARPPVQSGSYSHDYAPVVKQPAAVPPTDQPAASAEMDTQVGHIRRMVEALLTMQSQSVSHTPTELQAVRDHLLKQEVQEEIVTDVVHQLSQDLTGRQMEDPRVLGESLVNRISERILTQQSGQPAVEGCRISALIGPTGVGKTTTIAKLAANHKLREGRRVGMITIDTYRIAAVDQLKIYAEIIDVPLHVVLTAGELKAAIDSMRDYDVVLIDTAGRSQYDRLRLSQLSGFMRAAQPHDVHLVMAATAGRAAMSSTLERFVQLGANSVIVTKLDEATACGSVLNIAAAGKLPISFVKTGQDVPDDIQPADARRLAKCIVEGNLNVG